MDDDAKKWVQEAFDQCTRATERKATVMFLWRRDGDGIVVTNATGELAGSVASALDARFE